MGGSQVSMHEVGVRTAFFGSSCALGVVWFASVNTNIGSCPYVYLDTWSNEQENIFIEFDLSDLNSNSIINSAVLR